MSSIDSRVVQMKFDNAQFESGIRTTLGSLTALKTGLKLDGATKGLTDINAAASKGISLGNISAGVENISSKFSAMSVIGLAALSTIASKATSVGLQMAKSLSVKPMADGFSDYELKMGATQTIMSGTGENIGTVTKYLKELDVYADDTIYNLRDMTSNIGKFTNAGVKLPVATKAMMGVANVAALSGANAEEASRAMYNLGQAIGQGSVKLMDWKSVELANMGTMEFKQQLMDQAVAMGTLKKGTDGVLKTTKGTIVTTKNFSTTLADQWLTSEALTKTLGNYADKTTAIGKKAFKAAMEVKTFSMMSDTLKASMGTGWTDTFDILIGNLPEATAMWTSLTGVIGGMITTSATARNKVLGDWKALGGRTMAISAIKNAFTALTTAIKPIKDAFRSIFPATTGKQLYDITEAINHFFSKLKMGSDTAFKVQRIFQGLFSILDIGWMVLQQGINFFLRLFGAVTTGSGGFLTTLAKIGDWFNNLRYAIKNGEGLEKFFTRIGDPIVVVINLLKEFASFVGRVFSGLGNVDMGGLEQIQKRFEPLGRIGGLIADVWSRVGGFIQSAWSVFEPIAAKFSTFFSTIGDTISKGFGNADYSTILDTINTGLFAGLLLLFKNFTKILKGGIGVNVDATGGLFSKIKDTFGELTSTLKTMQASVKANILLKIAAALALLTISVVALSMINSANLTKSLTAMTVMFGQLMGAMYLFEKIAGLKGVVKMPIIAAALILLAIAIDLLSIAVTRLSKLSWKELSKGLLGVAVLMGVLVAASKGLDKNSGGMIRAGAGLILMAVAIRLLVSAVTDLSGLSWSELAKGLIGVGVILGALTFFTRFSGADKGGMSQGLGILLMAAGIKVLASALKDFATMSWEELGRGLAAMAGGLVIIGVALKLIPASSLLSAAAVLIVAASLKLIAEALGTMGGMTWEEIGKGLVVLAGSLLIIAVAMNAMTSAIFGAAALLVVAASLAIIAPILNLFGNMSWEAIAKGLVMLAGALAIIAIALNAIGFAIFGAVALAVVAASLALLAPVLLAFGNMEWDAIGKGLLMLAGVFLVIGVAGLLLTPVIPTLLGLGIAILLLGVGMLAAGAGLMLFATGLTMLSVAGVAATAMIIGIVSGLIGLIPMLLTQIGIAIIAFATVIATGGPAITKAITVVLLSLITAIATLTPVIVTTLLKLLFMMIDAIVKAVPRLVQAGFNILLGFLRGISNNIGRVVTVVGTIIVNFLNALANQLPKIISAGVNLIVKFVQGIGDGIPKILQAAADLILKFVRGLSTAINNNSAALGRAGGDLAVAMIRGLASGLSAGVGQVKDAAVAAAKGAFEAAKAFLHINSPSKKFFELGMGSDEGMRDGLIAYSGIVATAAEDVGATAIDSMRKSISGMSDLVEGPLDMSPTITPVIDLTDVQKGAGLIGTLLAGQQLAVGTAYSTAKNASAGYQANQGADVAAKAVTESPKVVSFVQNNTSPKALSAAEIYRQTKNQLSVAKGALTT